MVHVEDLAISKGEGRVTGRATYDVVGQLLSLDGYSTASPIAVARFVGPELDRFVSLCRAEGAATIEAKGTIGLKKNPTRNLRLHVKGDRLGWRWFLAEHAEFDMTLSDRATVIDNVDARWCEGNITGSLQFERATLVHTNVPCHLDLRLNGASLLKVVNVFRKVEDGKAYEGTLSGQCTLSGPAGADLLHKAKGTGRIEIKDGLILSLPVLGGLSKYLSLLIPGLGFANQRDLRGTFEIRDGAIHTADTQLLGKAITIKAKGAYTFGGDLAFRLHVLLLKEGITATITRLLTSPLTKALEFELTGTANKPRWRPVNTPDRLLKFFVEQLGSILPARRPTKDAASPVQQPASSSPASIG